MANVSSSNSHKGLAPQLRFQGFSNEWRQDLLCNVFSKINQRNTNGKIKNVICNSAQKGLIPQREYFDKDIANSDNTDGYYIIKQNDFVYNPRKSVSAPYGPISVYKYSNDGIVSPLYLCFRSIEAINVSFYEWYFKSPVWHRYVYLFGDSGVRHDRVSIKDAVFFEMPLHIPDNAEQEKIAGFLSLIEKKIQKQQQLVDSLKSYKRGLKSRLFDKTSNDWNTVKLSEILCERKTYCEKDGTYPHATLSKDGVSAKTERYDRDYLVASDDKKYKITHYGDICYNPANLKFGVICLNTFGSAIFSPIYITFEVNPNYDIAFIGECLTRADFINKALQYQQGTVYERMAVSPEDLLSMEIKTPSLAKQKQIAKCLKSFDTFIAKHEAILSNLLSLKTTLLQQLFI